MEKNPTIGSLKHDPETRPWRFLIAGKEAPALWDGPEDPKFCPAWADAMAEMALARNRRRPFAAMALDARLRPGRDAAALLWEIRAVDPAVGVVFFHADALKGAGERLGDGRAEGSIFLSGAVSGTLLAQLLRCLAERYEALGRLHRMERRLGAAAVQLRGARRLLRAFLDRQPGIAFIKDAAGRYLYLNRRGRRLFGVRGADYFQRGDAQLLPPEMALKMAQGDDRVASSGAEVRYPATLPPAGGRHWIRKFPLYGCGSAGADGAGRTVIICGLSVEAGSAVEAAGGTRRHGESGPAAAAPGGLPLRMPGLNVREGLRRTGDSAAMYVDLVTYFCEDKRDFYNRILDFVREGDYRAAEIEAHALKGSAATIAADDLSAAGRRLERACVDEDRERIFSALEATRLAFDRLRRAAAGLAALLPPPEPPPSAAGADGESLVVLMDRLERGLAEFDPMTSGDCARRLGRRLADTADAQARRLLSELSEQTAEYRFEDARRSLQALRGKVE